MAPLEAGALIPGAAATVACGWLVQILTALWVRVIEPRSPAA